ncbi:hypothetical protein Pelo_10355 [Pelomyxa schiedti]|nr:hypothetical protein Pelo_10355 [Pelomyxa schiedti]
MSSAARSVKVPSNVNNERCSRVTVYVESVTALCAGMHPRVGVNSLVNKLTPYLCRYIALWIKPQSNSLPALSISVRVCPSRGHVALTVDGHNLLGRGSCIGSFERLFQGIDNTQLYENAVRRAIDNFILTNAPLAIVAYGPGGCGKTYSLFGRGGDGVLWNIARHLLEHTDVFTTHCYEWTKLNPKKNLTLGLVTNEREFGDLVARAMQLRQVAATNMNFASTITPLFVEFVIPGKAPLFVVDLPGVCRLTKTGSEGSLFKQLVSSNQALSSYTQVLRQIAVEAPFIAYRSSEIARVLKDPILSGNTVLLAHISPDDNYFEESFAVINLLCSLQSSDATKPKKPPTVTKNRRL